MKPQIVVPSGFYVYLHCRPSGEPFYVGKGTGPRAYQLHRSRNAHHQAVVSKYGDEKIQVFVFQSASERQAMLEEQEHIAQLRADGVGLCNKTNGGDGFTGGRHTPESRALISAALIGNTRNLGKKRGPRVHSKEWREAHSKALLGRKASDETKKKMSDAHKGINTWSRGCKLSEETRAKISAALKGKKKAAKHG